MNNSSITPDYEGAIAYALALLHTKLPVEATYHCALHTEGDVMPAVLRLAQLSNLSFSESQELRVAAAYHDVGYIHAMLDHESIGIAMIVKHLPMYGFSASAVTRIASMIEATRMPQSPRNSTESLLADADLDSLGRDDFLEISKALWQERNAFGYPSDWPTWIERQLGFMQAHRYFTPAAQALRNDGKAKNIALLLQMISGEIK